MPALRRDDPLVAARRRGAHGVLVPGVPKRRGPRRAVTNAVAVRAPHLYHSLRGFALGAFRVFVDEDLPFAFEEHESLGRPALYEYRPLVRRFLESRASALATTRGRSARARRPARRAGRADLRARARGLAGERGRGALPHRRPAAARLDRGGLRRLRLGRRGVQPRVRRARGVALRRTVTPMRRVAPLVGISVGTRDRARRRNARAQRRHGRAGRALARGAGAAAARLRPRDRPPLPCSSSSASLRKGEPEPPDAPGELADAVTALRLATAGPIAAGPVLFERLDWRPYGIRPVLPIAATQPDGEPTRLDEFRGRLAADVARAGSPLADEDQELGEALDRWELSLFQADPFRGGAAARVARRRSSASGDGLWAASVRAAVLLGETPAESRQSCSSGCEARPAAAGRSSGARSSRSSCTATARGSLGVARRVAPRPARRGRRDISHFGQPADTRTRVAWRHGRSARGDRAAEPDRGARARERAPATTLLAELRELVREAEAWVRTEGDERAELAVERCKEALAAEIVHV